MQTSSSRAIKNILFTHYSDNWIRGSERCLLDLMQHIDKQQYHPILWCNQPIMQAQAERLGIEVYRSDFSILLGWQAPRFNLINYFRLIKQAKNIIQQRDIDLVHANSAAPCQWLNIAARQCNIPLLCHMHAIYPLRDRLTLGLYQVSMAVAVSEYVIAPFYQDKVSPYRTKVIVNGIDHEKLLQQSVLDLRPILPIKVGAFVIVAVGSLIKRKGMDLIIDALAQLLEKGFLMHLLIIGEGPEKAALKQQIEQLGLQQQVNLLGEQNNVMGILRGTADLFVSGAREEAFGLVFAEASLAGLAVVGPNIGGIPEVVEHGKTGLLVNAESSFSLGRGIEKLYLAPVLANRLGKAGQQHILDNFTITQNVQQFENTYQQLLNNPETFLPWYKNLSLLRSLQNGWQRFFKRGLTHGA